MTKMRLIISVLLICGCISLSAAAEGSVSVNVSADDNTGIMTVSGTVKGAKYGEAVGITVIKPNPEGDETDYLQKTISEIIEADMLTAYLSVITNSEGGYTAEISMSGNESGDYKIVVSTTADAKKPIREQYYFATLKNKTDLISEIAEYIGKSEASESGLADMLDIAEPSAKNAKLLGIKSDSIIYKVSSSGFNKVVFEVLKNTKDIVSIPPAEFVSKLEYAAKLTAFAEGVLNPVDYAEEFELDKTFIKTYSKLTDNQKTQYLALIQSAAMYNREEVQKQFNDSVCLAVIQKPGGWSDYSSLLENHGGYIGIDADDYAAVKKAGKADNITDYLSSSYTTVEAFKTGVNSAMGIILGSKPDGGGTTKPAGGGIGSGGWKGGSSTNTSVGGGTISGDTKTDAPETTDGSFVDLDSVPWAVESIKALVKKEIVNGIGSNMFDPDGEVTREQFAKMAVLAAGITPDSSQTAFEDVAADAWYSKYISAAVKNGVINGISETKFGTGEAVTRQDAAAILYRLAGRPQADKSAAFADDKDIAGYASDAVYALKAAGVINGKDNNMFCPTETCTRAEAAKMIYQFMLKFKE